MEKDSLGDRIKKYLDIDLSENFRSAMVGETTAVSSEQPNVAEVVVPTGDIGTLEVDEESVIFKSLEDVDAGVVPLENDSGSPAPARESFRSIMKTRVSYYIPILGWLPQYDYKAHLVSDLVAGLGVAAMLIPQSLAYAILARLPPQMGLYTAFFPVILYFILGTSKQLSIGPDALSSLLVGIITAEREFDDPHEAVPALAMLVGIVLFGLGIIRVGFLDNILSRPLLCGFVNAVALTIIMEQSDVFFGITMSEHGHHEHGWRKVLAAFHERHTASTATVRSRRRSIDLQLYN
jgi:hypothetical protein